MTVHKDFKKLVRERAQRTGESYAAARRSLLAKSSAPASAPIAATVHDLWFTRATKGYGSGRSAKPTGYEHHRVTIGADGTMRVDADVAFSNYGDHRYTVAASEIGRSSRYEYASPSIVVDASWQEGAWRGNVRVDDAEQPFTLLMNSDVPHPVPSMIGRFLPLRLARDAGELDRYTPLPEDAFPAWRPLEPKSWFPVMGASRDPLTVPRTIIGRGEETVALRGRRKVSAFRYDHVADDGRVLESTWIDEHEAVVRVELLGLVLVAADPLEIETVQ